MQHELEQFKLSKQQKRERLNDELMQVAIQMADLGKKMYELKEELRITNIQIEKCSN